MPFRIMPVILLVVPIIEIAVFILVGQSIGLGWTILGILVTAVLGAMLMRSQGLAVLNQIRDEVNAGRVPALAMAHGVLIFVAGVLLLTPGFVTDTLGFLLFVPGVRNWIWRTVAPWFFNHLSGTWSRWPGAGGEGGGGYTVIELSTDSDNRPDNG